MRQDQQQQLFLGIEGGGTHTRALLVREDGQIVMDKTGGPANVRLIDEKALVNLFRDFAHGSPEPTAIAIGLAGARTEHEQEKITRAAAQVWGKIPCYPTNDLETALAAAEPGTAAKARVLVLSGTGSCCYGQDHSGRVSKVGGWGHILGDKGSAYEIGLRAMKATVFYYDHDGAWPLLGQRLLRATQLNEPNDLISWVQTAGKDDIAALALEVLAAAGKGDRIARDILEGAVHSLAADAVACARKLVKRSEPVHFILAGGILLKQPAFGKRVARQIQAAMPRASVAPLHRESVWGAVELARGKVASAPLGRSLSSTRATEDSGLTKLLIASPTEQRNPRSRNLHKLGLKDSIRLMLGEDSRIPAALLREEVEIEKALRFVVRAFGNGGRLFYVGAGTSGRLGILDASECPPTFQADPEMVQGIIAGGQRAIWSAVEGAEDDPAAGAQAIRFRGVGKRDVVVGIAASGRTPFVWGALGEAKRRGSKTVLLCFNPYYPIPKNQRPDAIIAPNLGPEVLTGSTRLKAGTGTKLVLNILTTIGMVKAGKVLSNLMIDVKASNAKLRDRAIRILQELTGVNRMAAEGALEKHRWQIKEAWRSLKKRPKQGAKG